MTRISAAFFAAALSAGFLVAAQPAMTAEQKLAVVSVAAIPRGAGAASGATIFEYPGVETIDIQLTLRLDAASAAKVSIFAAAMDTEKWRIGKTKKDETIQPGETAVLLKDFVRLDQFFGRHDVNLEIEVSAKGFQTVRTKRAFSFVGVPEPGFRIAYTDLRPRAEPLFIEFLPGDDFELNFFYEIRDNPADLSLKLRAYAVMDSQNFRLRDASLSDPFWDEMTVPSEPGMYHVEIHGTVPDKFTDYYRQRHYFRVILQFEFDGGIEYVEPVDGMIFDEFYGVQREPVSIQDSFVEMQPSSRWRVDEMDERSFERRIREFRELRRTRRLNLYY